MLSMSSCKLLVGVGSDYGGPLPSRRLHRVLVGWRRGIKPFLSHWEAVWNMQTAS